MRASKKIGFNTINVRKTREEILREKKLVGITKRVRADFTAEEREQMIMADSKLRNLHIDREKALKAEKIFSANIFLNQIENRVEEIVFEKTAEKILNLIDNGQIIRYLEDEDSRTFLAYTLRSMMLLDALDSSFQDMSDLLRTVGLKGDVVVSKEIKAARESIDRYFIAHTYGVDDDLRSLILDHADKVYEFVKKRVPMLNRKYETINARKSKQKENGKA